eukprot:4104029-Prymnesium_polylepis.1
MDTTVRKLEIPWPTFDRSQPYPKRVIRRRTECTVALKQRRIEPVLMAGWSATAQTIAQQTIATQIEEQREESSRQQMCHRLRQRVAVQTTPLPYGATPTHSRRQ